ncbi:PTS cellobiose transporter subunit IIC [Clostridium botulinum]|uniref:PTS cellobiose transporter subunit IIC n=1 Tax=Clostridium botulinum TaxID=1491 RepID=UPI000378FA4E|nr:PTS cellobiose transporter subunit IIC [Clostridium botulinum]NFF30137.1 PTS cellobiose transporter subunit IIC [Clostridium botulinum]NFF60330.1 PTS cellobiose transporter subunit IIC [Clostridium botulinum]NFL02824.1 PTS cellobiose transporter subunit IIC [Clostridium botulinum]NFQ89908.1 PTS cellobiose transporter subunit IIC [Clostridium botulinum]NFR03075.1 PTS cellobiose transporter subunit IIC [Clostridium botulinum]
MIFMNNFLERLQAKIAPTAMKVGNQRHLLSIRDGIMAAMPLIIIGSIFLILGNLPFEGYDQWLAIHGHLDAWLGKIVNGSFGIMGLVASFSVAYSLAKSYKVDGVSAGVISLSCFLISTPNIVLDKAQGIPMEFMGSKGLFAAMVIGMISAEIFRKFVQKNIVIKMPEAVPPAVSQSFVALIPGIVIIALFGIIYKILGVVDIGSIHDLISVILGKPLGLLGSTLIGTIISIALNSVLWMFGIHGGSIVNSIMQPMWLINTDANRIAWQAGKELPNIITQPFIDNFVYIGGSGATLALVILAFFIAKGKQTKMIGKLALVPGIFNINEPAMFGLPVVMNLVLFIPFILTPMVNSIITYCAMASGLVMKTVGISVAWTMPPVISGYLATGGHVSGALLHVVLIIIDIIIYYPFFKMLDKREVNSEL